MGGNKRVGETHCLVIKFLRERRGSSGVFGKCQMLTQVLVWQGGGGADSCLLPTARCSARKEPCGLQQAGRAPACKHLQVLHCANHCGFADCLWGRRSSLTPLAHR